MAYLTDYILTFVLFAFIGYICEVLYCSILDRHLTNRGFLYGPWLPIYGFGGLVIELFLVPVSASPVLVFLLGMVLTSAVEYVGSWMLEKLFDVKLWDYSHYRFHINGRVCLLNSSLFGIMGLVLVYFLEPYKTNLIHLIPASCRDIVSLVLAILFTVDLTLSIVKMKAFQRAMEDAIKRAKEMEERARAFAAQGKMELAQEVRERLQQELLEQKQRTRVQFNRILNAFPHLTSHRDEVKNQIKNIQQWALERKLAKEEFKAKMKEIHEEYKEKVSDIDTRAKGRKND
ncbi:MAG: hypothetical protein KBS81_06990 [Spirochaetales bacterium]|nr:hypothetical protein [Candidatus Physcosoma equi]